MRARTTLGEVLPVLGTIGLLGLWLFQQTGIEERNAELRKLAGARDVYQTYQSNNALFNAIIETVAANERAVNQIRMFQIYNYELGLRALDEALPSSEKAGIPAAVNAYDASSSVADKMALTQKRLERLQEGLAKREAEVSRQANKAKELNLWLYLGLSVLMIVGAVLKTMEKLYPLSK
jgi:hypothetical protein